MNNKRIRPIRDFIDRHPGACAFAVVFVSGAITGSYLTKRTHVPVDVANRIIEDSFKAVDGNFQRGDGTYKLIHITRVK